MNFFKKERKFSPFDESILRTLSRTNKKVTPSEIASYVRIHPVTAQKHIKELSKKGYVKCRPEGRKMYCEINREKKLPF